MIIFQVIVIYLFQNNRKDYNMTREEELKREYEHKLAVLRNEQNNCNHIWEDVKYDPDAFNSISIKEVYDI